MIVKPSYNATRYTLDTTLCLSNIIACIINYCDLFFIYRIFKSISKYENYLVYIENSKHPRALVKFRLSNQKLLIEEGRRKCAIISRNERILPPLQQMGECAASGLYNRLTSVFPHFWPFFALRDLCFLGRFLDSQVWNFLSSKQKSLKNTQHTHTPLFPHSPFCHKGIDLVNKITNFLTYLWSVSYKSFLLVTCSPKRFLVLEPCSP